MSIKPLSAEHGKFLQKERKYSFLVAVTQIGLLAIVLIVWELLARTGVIDSFISSSPSRIVKTIINTFKVGDLSKHIWISTYETIVGFAAGTLLGTLIAIIMWWSKFIKRVLEPYVVVLNSLPKIALGPIIIIWVGTGTESIIVMALLVSVVITTITMLSGFCQTNADKLLLFRTMNANKYQVFTKLVFPSNIPTLVASLKINVGMAWVGTIMGEYLNSKAGLGYLIVYGSQVFKLDLVMACTVILCLLAGVMYFLVALLEKTIIKWKE
ncbi:MAG: ABC transporter permease [Clostridia bacterium]|nr:ABC transporter permease [Clostridia bacterium]